MYHFQLPCKYKYPLSFYFLLFMYRVSFSSSFLYICFSSVFDTSCNFSSFFFVVVDFTLYFIFTLSHFFLFIGFLLVVTYFVSFFSFFFIY